MKQFSELIKNFNKIRDYMRDFYVFGFKTRGDVGKKSPRSYDNEKRRIESYLAEYMSFYTNENGKNVFLSVDSGEVAHNPFYRAFKAKTFTKNDISLHFILPDILSGGGALTVEELLERVTDDYFALFEDAETLDVSTLRKKLAEYVRMGVVLAEKDGRKVRYSLAGDDADLDGMADAIAFFSEVSPLGVVGSYLLDKLEDPPDYLRFKHHYVAWALESEVLLELLLAIRGRREAEIVDARDGSRLRIVPFKILAGTQAGRRYVAAWDMEAGRGGCFRLDYIRSVHAGGQAGGYGEKKAAVERQLGCCWGVSSGGRMHTLKVRIKVEAGEEYIVARIRREGRQGRLRQAGEDAYLYEIEAFDLSEMIPFLRTFVGRILSMESTDKEFEARFAQDVRDMYALYGVT